jgi:hypothetical protein
MRFGLRRLLLIVATTAVLLALFVAARHRFYAGRLQTQAILAEIQGISNIQLHAHIDIVEEVNASSFSVDRLPGSIIRIGGLEHYGKQEFAISQIGQWTFRVSGRRHGGAYSADTGEPVESDYYGGHIVFGGGSPYNDLIPFEVNSLQDVVDHYEEFVTLLQSWPRESEPGTVTLADGTLQYFYVLEDGK